MKSRLRTHAPALLLWTLLWAASCTGPLVGTHHLRGGDTTGQYYAFALFQSRQMRQLQWPVWSPGSYGGFPFAADVQSAVFYPPRWLTITLAAPWGELPYHALEWEALAHVWLAGVGIYLLVHTLTRDRWAGLLAATAFGLGGYLTGYPLLQFPILETAAWLPWTLWALSRAASAPRPWRWLSAAAGLMAMSAAAGHPQTWMQGGYLCAGYYLFATVRARWAWRNILGFGGGVALLTVGLTVPVWLPALRYLPYTSRQEVGYDFISSGMPALDWLQAALPAAWTVWSPQYLGATGLVCAALGWLRRRTEPAWARYEAAFWGLAAIAGAWLSLGGKGVLFRLAYGVLPGLNAFRQQERWALWWALGMSVLAGLGLATWRQDAPQSRHALRWSAGLVTGLVAAASLVQMAQGRPWGVWGLLALKQVGLIAAVCALLGWGGAKPHARWRWARGGALLALLALDLALVAHSTGNVQPGAPNQYWPSAPWLQALGGPAAGRIQTRGILHANLGEIYALEDVAGISPLRPKALDALKKLDSARTWQLLGVAQILSPKPLTEPELTLLREVPAATLPGQETPAYLYHYDGALPHAALYTQVMRASDEAQIWALLGADEFDPARQIVLEEAAPRLPNEDVAATGAGVAQVARPDARTLVITTDAPADAYLLVREWRYPGWRAWLDGAPTHIYRANGAWQAMLVPSGSHQLRLRYTAPDALWGVLCAACLLIVGGLAAWRWRPAIHLRASIAPARAARPWAVAQSAWQPAAWWPWALTLLALTLRLCRLGAQDLNADEALTYLLARLPLSELLPSLLRQGGWSAPLPALLLHGGMQLGGRSEFALRLPSLLCGALLTPTLWQVGVRLGDRRLALALAGAAALAQSQVWLAQDVHLHETLALLLAAWATLWLLRAIEQPRWDRWLLYGAGCAACLYTSGAGLFALVGHALYLAALRKRHHLIGRWAAALLWATALLSPWLWAAWPGLAAGWSQTSAKPPELTAYLFKAGIWLALGTDVPREAGQVMLLAMGGLWLLGVRSLWRAWRPLAALSLGWLISAAAGLYLAQVRGVAVDVRAVSCATPALWLGWTGGLARLWRARTPWGPTCAVAVLLLWVGVNGQQLYTYYLDPDAGRSAGYRIAAEHLRAAAQASDVLLTATDDPRWGYYLEGATFAHMPLSALSTPAQSADSAMQALAAQCNSIWLGAPRGQADERTEAARDWLDAQALLMEQDAFGRQQLALYRPLRLAEQEMTPLDATWGEAAHLRGYTLLIDGQRPALQEPWRMRPGGSVQVTLLWEAVAPVRQDYTVFVHLLGADGRLLAQHDGAPAFGNRPTSTWQLGETLLDRHELMLPAALPPKAATLVVGLYRADTLARHPLPDGRDTLPLGSLSIAP